MTPNHIKDPQADLPFDWTFKGLPPCWIGLTAAQIGDTETHLFGRDISFPVAILKQPTIAANRAWMRNFLAVTGTLLAPHGKTTMAPELFRQQAEDGAWAITAATPHHVRLYRKFGVSRIFMANQLVGPAEIDWVLDELDRDPAFDFYCLIDSLEGVRQLSDRAGQRTSGTRMQVLVETGRPGGRCGVRGLADGLAVARAASAAKGLALVGIETFEGLTSEAADSAPSAQSMLDELIAVARACIAEELFTGSAILLSAGGSAFFDLAARTLRDFKGAAEVKVVLRSGCYISHDDGTYERLFRSIQQRTPAVEELGPGLAGALQVWAKVQSVPEPGQIVCALGRRDVGTETDPPRALAWVRAGEATQRAVPPGLVTSKIYDQHTVLSAPSTHPLQVGDLVGFGVSHPCTTFDKWRTLLVVDDQFVIRDVVRTYF